MSALGHERTLAERPFWASLSPWFVRILSTANLERIILFIIVWPLKQAIIRL